MTSGAVMVSTRALDPVEPDREADRGHGRAGGLSRDQREQAVVAAAADERPPVAAPGIVNLEDEAGVVVEPAAEIGGEGEAAEIDAVLPKILGARLEGVDRLADVELLAAGERAERRQRLVGCAGEGEEAVEHLRRAGAVPGASGKARLFEEAVGDLARAAAADGADAGKRQQVLDHAVRGVVVGAVERGEEAFMRRRGLVAAESFAISAFSRGVSPKARASRRRQGSPRSSAARTAAKSAELPIRTVVLPPPRSATASSASLSMSASAAALSPRPSDSTPACRNSPFSPGRWRKIGPR